MNDRTEIPVGVPVESAVSRLVSAAQLAHEWNVSIRLIWRRLAKGDLTRVRIGRATRITRASADAFIARGGSNASKT